MDTQEVSEYSEPAQTNHINESPSEAIDDEPENLEQVPIETANCEAKKPEKQTSFIAYMKWFVLYYFFWAYLVPFFSGRPPTRVPRIEPDRIPIISQISIKDTFRRIIKSVTATEKPRTSSLPKANYSNPTPWNRTPLTRPSDASRIELNHVFQPPTSLVIPDGRLRISAMDGTDELTKVMQALKGNQIDGLGLLLSLASGFDFYGLKIRVANVGKSPVDFFPENFLVHFGEDTARTTVLTHANFLKRCRLNPGDSVQGLIMYQARIDLGAAMRLNGASFSYDDSTVKIEYGP